MRDNPEGGELEPAVDDSRRCKKNSPSVFFLFYFFILHRCEGCDRGSEVGTVHSRRGGVA